jgi:protein-S-isoprenylcysteine O-methyltransferase Ste14
MNGIARFVYRVATRRGTLKTVLSVAGAVFWYGTVALAMVFSSWVDGKLGLSMAIPAAVRFPLAVVLLAVGAPMVAWTISRFLKTRGTPIPFSPPPVFVTDGLYKIVRNPMHLGWTLVIVGVGVLRQSFTLLAIFTPVFILAHILYIKLIEEKELEEKFGQAYREYKKRVGMFLPRFRKR